jgi:hypothetical protein
MANEEQHYDVLHKLLYPRVDRLRPVSKMWDDQDRIARRVVQDGLPDMVRACVRACVRLDCGRHAGGPS